MGTWNDEVHRSNLYDHPETYLSLESRMACGMGCYACVLKVPDSETVNLTCL